MHSLKNASRTAFENSLKALKEDNFKKCVQIEWEDGFASKFHYVWLADNSKRRPSLIHLDLNVRPESLQCSRTGIKLLWPPFLSTEYSSNFLRQNALKITKHLPSSNRKALIQNNVPTQPGFFSTVKAPLRIDPRRIIKKMLWFNSSQEPGTLWAHMQSIPSLSTVENLNNVPTDLILVNTHHSISLLKERHPTEFEFLKECEIEYTDGFFKARHRICSEENGLIIPGVFNNVLRSSAITTDSVEILYKSLQKLGRSCAEVMQLSL